MSDRPDPPLRVDGDPLWSGPRHIDDPRDLPGGEDHQALMHPHGLAAALIMLYDARSLDSFNRTLFLAHRDVSDDYLRSCQSWGELPRPLCGVPHFEVISHLEQLPHSLREGMRDALARLEERLGGPAGIVRVYRHFGLDCAAAEVALCDCPPEPGGAS
jgi:hypothetical protein